MPDPPSREGTVAITAHLPPEVRERLKILAAHQRRTMNELIAEALEDRRTSPFFARACPGPDLTRGPATMHGLETQSGDQGTCQASRPIRRRTRLRAKDVR